MAERRRRRRLYRKQGQLVNQAGKPNKAAKYLLKMPGLNVQLRQTGFSYDTYTTKNKFHRVDIELLGANLMAVMTTGPPVSEPVNMINEHGAFYGIRKFQSVTYHDVYPGIDLEFVARKGTDKPVEYNFIVRPGADASKINLKYKGANQTALENGRIVMDLNQGKLSENIPASWVKQTGKKLNVRYKSLEGDVYAFNVPAYDRNKTLIIDPTPQLLWATYYGGSGEDQIGGLTTDSQGNIYFTGHTTSAANIATAGAYDGTYGGGLTGSVPNEDVFVAKFNSAGQRLWATYYGATGRDLGYSIAVSGNDVYIGGVTTSAGMSTPGAHQTTQTAAGQNTGFLAKFDATSGQRTWGTYYGGNAELRTTRIAVDADGNFYIYGDTNLLAGVPTDMTTPGTFNPATSSIVTNQPLNVLVKFNASGVRQWGTYIGEQISYNGGLALDADGQPYVAGGTSYTDVNLAANATEGQTKNGVTDGFIVKIDKVNGQRIWGRYFGGPRDDYFTDIHIDKASQVIYAVGSTKSASGIATPGSFRPTLPIARETAGILERDSYLASFNLSGLQIMGTYLNDGSGGFTNAQAVTQNSQGEIIVSGNSRTSSDLSTDCSYQPNLGGSNDQFINQFTQSGQRVWGTYFGGSAVESSGTTVWNGAGGQTKNLATDVQGNVIIGLLSGSAGLATAGSHQTAHGGGTFDVMVAKFNDGSLPDGFAVSASTLAPMTQNACILGIPAVIEGNAVGVTSPVGYSGKLFYQWQKSDNANGPWEDMPGEVFKDLQPLASQTTIYYRRLVKVNAELCNQQAVDSSQVASVVINANAAPIANADGPQWYVCGAGANTVTLNGTATGGSGTYSSYQWYIGSTSTGTLAASTASFTTPAITQATTYTLQVTDAAGCVDIDQVTVVPAVANAGTAKSICQGNGGVQIGTPPVASPSVAYNWTSISGDPVSSLSCTTCAQPIANPAVVTTYRLTVTVAQKSGATCTTTSDVTVTPVAAPNNTVAFAGTDKTLCKNTSVALGGTNDATFAYTWTSGQYLSNSQVANPTFNAGTAAVTGGSINYTVTATKNGCAFTDEVKVSVLNSRISDQDETICGPAWSSHLDEDNAPGTTYTWSVVSGTGTVLQTRNGGKDAYLSSTSGVTRFRRTVTLNGVTCTADVLIQPCTGPGTTCDFEILTLSEQGCPKVFGSTALRLGSSLANPSDYNFSWSPANLVDNASAATVNITSTAQATITLTVTNKYDASITCVKSIAINAPGWSLPVFATTDKYTCPNVPIQIGNAAVAGFTYAWTPVQGLSDPAISNPTATVATSQTFAVVVTETASGCKTSTDVTVNSSAPTANAGNDRAVCNGATVTLGSAPPAGTNWTYSWEPANTAWTNGTDANDAQPQVQFAFATPQSYILTVTDPLSGCTASDTVVLRNTVATGEYAGAGVTTCEGLPVQLGRDAEPFAQYQWFMADGTTPATGLSSNTAANPTVTNPTATTTYVVKVSYPGCNTPLTDQITVTVNAVGGLALLDKVVCPAGPIAIGYGATGNPAAPAGATYLWSPATGLSSTTAANPTATISSETTYTVTVTLASGCTFTDQVKVSPSANAGSDATICPGESTVIGVAAVAGATYSWTGAGIVSGATTAQPTVKPTVTTTYSVSVTLNGCTTTDDVVVTVNTPADFAITGNTAICQGGVATLSLSGTAAANTTWQWSPLAGVSAPNGTSTTVAATSTQTYRLTQTNLTTGCSNYKEVVLVVNPNTIAATVGNVNVCSDVATTLPLNVTSSGSYSYVWSPSVGLSNAFIANPTVTTGSPRTYTVTVTDNASQCQLVKQVNVAINAPEACFAPVTLTGNVFHDANALKDVTVNSTATDPAIPTGLYVTLVDSTGTAVKTVPVNADGTYDFGVTAPGDYSIVLNQTSTGSTTPSLPAGWVNTGENLGSGVGSDSGVNGILTGVTVAGTNVTNANFGIQLPPVTTGGTEPTQQNPGGATTVDLTSHFGLTDSDGTVSSITFTEFPENVETITINGTTYVAPGETPGSGQQVWPAGNVTVPGTGLSVLVDPVDGDVATSIPFFVTDNGGLESNVSTVTADFTTPVVQLSGNVFHDANALTDSTVNTTGSVTTIPTGLFVTLVDSTGAAIATVPVNADGSYDFGDVTPGTYSVVLHQTAAGSTTPSLPTGWNNTGEHLGANAGSDGTVNGILPNIVVTATDVTNANFGVQQPPVTTDEALPSAVNPGGTVTVDISDDFNFTDPDGTVESITFTEFPDSVTTVTINGVTYVAPGETPGSGQQVFPDSGVTVPVTDLEVLIDPIDGNPTVDVPFTVTDNGGLESNESSVTKPFTTPVVGLSGNVFHDSNALTDSTVNTTGSVTTIPTGLFVTLVDSTGAAIATVPVNADGSYDFGDVTPGTYSVVLHQTAAGSTTPSLPTGWNNTGEHLGANTGSDGTVNGILPNIVVTATDVTNANFGVQQPPVTTDEALPSSPNPGGTVTVDISDDFNFTDPDGTVESITFTEFPDSVTTVTINGVTYVAPGETPGSGQQVFPDSGVTVPVTDLEVLIDPIDGNPTVDVPFTVTDNGGLESNESSVTKPFTTPVVGLSGNVFHDSNALTDSTVNTTGSVTTIPTGLFVTLVDSTGTAIATVPVNADGSYDFGDVTPGTYSVVLHQTAAGSTTPSLPTGWNNTGEHLGANTGSDGTVNGILPNIVVTATDVTNANFGVQQPPVTTDEALPSSPNPGGTVTVDISDDFNFTDPDGTVETITFTQFPDSVTTVTINGVTYVAPGETPGSGQQVFPDSGVTVPVTDLEVLIDPIDGNPTVDVPFTVTDNGGLESNESSVTKPFTTTAVQLSGNVFHDANALTDSTVNTTGSVTTIPTGLFVTLVDSTGAAIATVPVNADGSYDFGDVTPGTYSVVLHQTAAGSTTPSLPTGWNNTGEHLGANTGSDGTVNGILPNIVVTATDVTNANFGVQQPPVADPKEYLIDQPAVDAVISLNGSHVSTGPGTSSPGQLTGTDPEDGTLNGSGKDRTVVITTLPDNGELYYNGVLVTEGQVIPNYDPALTTIKLTGTGYTSTTFEYAYVDEAGEQSPPAPYTIRWEKPLPVTLVSFTATARENTAELTWATSEETNSDRFEIQRSLDGKAWSAIGSVKAEGESKVRKTYNYSDHQAELGANNLYRLKMIDNDSSFAFSAIRSVRFDSKLESSIYPNPVADQLTLKVTSWKQVKTIRIDNLTGVQVYNSGPVESGKVDVSKLDSGVYILRITHTDGSVHTHKFVHIK
jgi:hypothetical protein